MRLGRIAGGIGIIGFFILCLPARTLIGSRTGTLVVIIRTNEGVVVASDSRQNDTFNRVVRDGFQKIDGAGGFAWFLTGHPIHVAYDKTTRREKGRVDLYQVTRGIERQTRASSALEMAQAIAAKSANVLNDFYTRYGLRFAAPGTQFALLGVVHQTKDMALALLKASDDALSVRVEIVPVVRVPRIGVFGNDRVYNAIKKRRPGFEQLNEAIIFQRIMYEDADPSRAEAVKFARWLIEVTSLRDAELGKTEYLVGGPAFILVLTNERTEWLAKP